MKFTLWKWFIRSVGIFAAFLVVYGAFVTLKAFIQVLFAD
jgi:hypothetical protein